MAAEPTCPRCDAPLFSENLGGLCPRCVGGLGFATAISLEQPNGETWEAVERAEIEDAIARLKPEEAGDVIGNFKLIEQIGEGGFGTVWVADQDRPVRRRVALKIIKLGMDTKEVIARFEQERQALAMMDHPHIARVLDAGATQWGRPYFVMELVRGIKITDYCDQANLSTRERLQLFEDVCSAINHAHQKGIIHRDIKPSNVMVTLDGSQPVVKVIDFGIAKATQGKLTDKTIFTSYDHFIGTPVYMSPEQASLSGLDVDTRTDIYALGVLLYELLVGKPPFDAQTLASAGYEEMRRIIREVEPAKPSSRLSTIAGDERARLAKARQIEPGKLSRMVESDLDWIVMKAIEKDRARRYATVNGFAQDIRRFLANEPVTAAAPSVAYLFRKFARRNKATLAVVGLIVVVLVAATGISLWQAKEAIAAKKDASGKAIAERVAREESEAITKFLIGVFERPSPQRDGRTITVAETLERAVTKLDADLTSQPERRAKLLETIGVTYIALGLARDAIKPLEKARDLLIPTVGPQHPSTLATMRFLGAAFHGASRKEEALKLREGLLAMRRKMLEPDDRDTLTAMGDLAVSYHGAGRLEEALKLQEEILPLSRKRHGIDDFTTLEALGNLGAFYYDLQRWNEAHNLLTEALAIASRLYGPKSPDTLLFARNVATSLDTLGKHEEALKMREENFPLNREVNGEDHPDTLHAMTNLGVSYARLGRTEEALKIQEQVLPKFRSVLGPENSETLGAMTNLAVTYRKRGRLKEAIELQTGALDLKRRFLPKGHRYIPEAVENLADCYRDSGLFDEERRWRLELNALRGKPTDPPNNTLPVPVSTAVPGADGTVSLDEALKRVQKTKGVKNAETVAALTELASAYGADGSGRKAIASAEEALALARSVLPSGDPHSIEVMKVLVALYKSVDLHADAAKLEAELKSLTEKNADPESESAPRKGTQR